MDGTVSMKQKIEDTLLLLGEKLEEEIYQRYTEGEMEAEKFQEINKLISEWFDNGQKLLEIVT